MTAPFAPPMPPAVKIVLALMACMAVAVPFAKRHDWIGWTAFLAMIAVTVTLWSMLLWGIGRKVMEWWRGGPEN